ncbi:hypothetical protein [Phenylobacterium kunshanense]|uniref:Cell surface protein n=1 Tax=Phenylobacterium kunshanense TaxID=1445034 RepID=A0A328BKZ5_9CAUL|nr:hypothetical protein [Phenylobacterium kunshanense]RAK67637.1 hypothetical protein DJ019_06955 [Phenylobacterium kunshanense]
MRTLAIAAVLGLGLAVAACSEAERRDAGNDLEAAADKVGAEVKDAVDSPEVKEVGAEIKDAAGDAGQVIKDAAKGAAEGAREGAAKVEAESGDAAN